MVDNLWGISQAMQDRAEKRTAAAPARVSSRKKQKVGSYESYDEFAGGLSPGRIRYPNSFTTE
jgi:hypothetical protein